MTTVYEPTRDEKQPSFEEPAIQPEDTRPNERVARARKTSRRWQKVIQRLGQFLDGWSDTVIGMAKEAEFVRDQVDEQLAARMPDKVKVERVEAVTVSSAQSI